MRSTDRHGGAAIASLTQCRAARVAWIKRMKAGWCEAEKHMNERCDAAVGVLDEEAFHRVFKEQQAKVDVFRLALVTASEKDMWPRELYCGCL